MLTLIITKKIHRMLWNGTHKNVAQRTQPFYFSHVIQLWWTFLAVQCLCSIHFFRHMSWHICHLQYMLSELDLITRQEGEERSQRSCQVEVEHYFCSHSTQENLGTWLQVAAREFGKCSFAVGADRKYENILVGT